MNLYITVLTELICECFDPDFDALTPCTKHSDTGCIPFTGDCGLGSRTITLDCPHAPKETFELKCCIKCKRPGTFTTLAMIEAESSLIILYMIIE